MTQLSKSEAEIARDKVASWLSTQFGQLYCGRHSYNTATNKHYVAIGLWATNNTLFRLNTFVWRRGIQVLAAFEFDFETKELILLNKIYG